MRAAAFALLAAACACAGATAARAPRALAGIRISDLDALEIGKRIWDNECGGTERGLTSWNAGEEFASLGIGHFIWYPENYRGPFIESFPKLVAYLEKKGVALPAWLLAARACPWPSREEFIRDIGSERMIELRKLLAATVGLQARFAAGRLEEALPKMLEGLPAREQERVRGQFYRVAREPLGPYALMDYVNFKGEGTSITERYAGRGWGLLQVLQGMSGSGSGPAVLEAFARSAQRQLERRVRHSPPERDEARWLPVWRRRLETYLAGR